jgi:hypothetical protein
MRRCDPAVLLQRALGQFARSEKRRQDTTGPPWRYPWRASSSVFLLPLLDERRTHCYECRIEEMPDSLAV